MRGVWAKVLMKTIEFEQKVRKTMTKKNLTSRNMKIHLLGLFEKRTGSTLKYCKFQYLENTLFLQLSLSDMW